MDYRMTKGRDGWQAESFIPLPDRGENWRIRLTTAKPPFGGKGIRTTAGTEQKTDFGFTTRIPRDFHRTVLTNPTVRCTEKTVREQHEQVLRDHLQLILDTEAAFEAEQVAREQADRIAA
jgi:hypothetical protein